MCVPRTGPLELAPRAGGRTRPGRRVGDTGVCGETELSGVCMLQGVTQPGSFLVPPACVALCGWRLAAGAHPGPAVLSRGAPLVLSSWFSPTLGGAAAKELHLLRRCSAAPSGAERRGEGHGFWGLAPAGGWRATVDGGGRPRLAWAAGERPVRGPSAQRLRGTALCECAPVRMAVAAADMDGVQFGRTVRWGALEGAFFVHVLSPGFVHVLSPGEERGRKDCWLGVRLWWATDACCDRSRQRKGGRGRQEGHTRRQAPSTSSCVREKAERHRCLGSGCRTGPPYRQRAAGTRVRCMGRVEKHLRPRPHAANRHSSDNHVSGLRGTR